MENEFIRKKIILRVVVDTSEQPVIEVPVSPDTLCSDVLTYCNQGHNCHLAELWRGCERVVCPDEHLYEILEQWGAHRRQVAFYLRQGRPAMPVPQQDGRRPRKGRNGLRDEEQETVLGSGVDLTLTELHDMASRQQRQIDEQTQMMVAKEQRLKFLKQQEVRHQQIASENERLRKLREKVDAQELKLKKLRALRGQVTDQKGTNNTLSSELECIRALFNDKEKELTLAVGRVEDLTKQLDQLRRGQINGLQTDIQPLTPQHSQAITELNKLRKELVIRNKLNDQQNSKMAAHRDILKQRTLEMATMDQRIGELQERLRIKKKMQEEQITNRNHSNNVLSNAHHHKNVATVEPYRVNESGTLSKSDPKYQSLPYNVKFPEPRKDIRNQGQGQISTGAPSAPVNRQLKKVSGSSSAYPDHQGTPVSVASHGSPSILYAAGESPGNPQTSTPVFTGLQSGSVSQHPSTPVNTKQGPKGGDNREIFITAAPTSSSHSRTGSQTTDLSSPPPTTTHHSGKSSPSPSHIPPPSSSSNQGRAGSPQYPGGHDRQGSDEYRRSESASALPQHTQHAPGMARQVTSESSLHSTKPPRYASADVIANTYMTGKLTSDAMDQYRKNMNQLYKDMAKSDCDKTELSSTDKTGTNLPGSGNQTDTLRVQAPRSPSGSPLGSPSGPASPSGKVTKDSPIKPQGPIKLPMKPDYSPSRQEGRNSPNLSQSGGSPYNIDPERSRYQGHHGKQHHAPRPLRHRHSSGGDSPEGIPKAKIRDSPEGYPKEKIAADARNDENSSPDKNRTESAENLSQERIINPPDLIRVDQIQKDEEDSEEEVDKDSGAVVAGTVMTSPQDGDIPFADDDSDIIPGPARTSLPVALRKKKGNLKSADYIRSSRRVSFDPLALLLDAALEGEIDLVVKSAQQVSDPSCPNDEGITALHNAICAGHSDIVKFLVEYGCNVNSPDSDGWTPLHCAASCNNLGMVRTLVEHGACIFAETISDHETAAEKCEEDEEGYHGCSQYLYSIQEKLGIANKGSVFAVFDYQGVGSDELWFSDGDQITVLRKGDEVEREWWWATKGGKQGYVPRNLLGMFPRVVPKWLDRDESEA